MIRISCKNERFTYDMYHIVKSFLPDAEISQKVDPEQELLIEMTAEEEPDLEEQACDKKVRWTFLSGFAISEFRPRSPFRPPPAVLSGAGWRICWCR